MRMMVMRRTTKRYSAAAASFTGRIYLLLPSISSLHFLFFIFFVYVFLFAILITNSSGSGSGCCRKLAKHCKHCKFVLRSGDSVDQMNRFTLSPLSFCRVFHSTLSFSIELPFRQLAASLVIVMAIRAAAEDD